jgi:CRP/FNR family cyclic AMP-dependent transcriptional regulator
MRLDTLFPSSEPYISFKAGQTIFKEGDPGDFMYVLVEGIVEVHVKEKVVGAFEPVESFGEMAVIDPGPRSATVVAKGNCRVARINQARFLVLVRNRPEFALHIMQMLVERMRWMDSAAATNSEQAQQIAKLQEENQELKALLAAMSPQPAGALAEA